MLRNIVKDSLVYGASDFVLKLISFSLFPIYAHIFRVDEYGVLTLVSTIAGFILLLLNLGMNNAVQRFYFEKDTGELHKKKIISTGLWVLISWSVSITLIVLGVSWFMSDVIATRYGVSWLLLCIALMANVPAQILQFTQDTLRLHFSPWRYALVAFVKNVSGAMIGLLCILVFGMGIMGFFAGNFIAFFVALPLAFVFIRKDLVRGLDKELARKLINFGYPFIFVSLAYWIFGSIDRLMLAEMSDKTNVGWLGIAFMFATVLSFINSAFGQAWSPHAFKIAGEDQENHRKVFSKILSKWFFFIAFIGAGVSLFSEELLMLTTPKEYWPASLCVIFLSMGLVLQGTTQITALGISLKHKTGLLSRAAWITAVVNVLINLILIPVWGAVGSAISTFLSYMTLSALYMYWSQKLYPLPLEYKKLLLILMSCFVVIIISILCYVYIDNILLKIALKALVIAAFAFTGISANIISWHEITTLIRNGIDRLPFKNKA
ncbi:MAG: oligosaccharide flippase family protein [Bacteroidota bacterium]